MRDILKAFLKTGTGTIVTLFFEVLTLKLVAVITGPAGIGLFSLLRQIRQTAITVATFNGQTALVQGASTRKELERQEYLSSILVVMLAGIGIVVGGMIIFAPWIAGWVTGKDDPATITLVRWLVVPVALGVCLAFLNGVQNTYRAIGQLALVQIVIATTMILIAYPVAQTVKSGYPIAFIGLMSVSALAGVGLSLVFVWRSGWLGLIIGSLKNGLKVEAIRHFFAVAGTMAVTGMVTTGTLLAIRALIVRQSGLNEAGLFDVAWTLSMMYVMLILSSFQTYYLPTLSQIKDAPARTLLMKQLLRFSTLLMVPLIISVIVLKPLVVSIFYSDEFTPSILIMRWMLIGDYFKVTSWILAMPMLAYADMKIFFWAETIWNGIFLIIVAWMVVGQNFLQGIGIAFLFLYAAYLIYMLYYTHSRYQFTVERKMGLTWLLGLSLLLGASWNVWTDIQVDFFKAGLWIGSGALFSLLMLAGNEREMIIRQIIKKQSLLVKKIWGE